MEERESQPTEVGLGLRYIALRLSLQSQSAGQISADAEAFVGHKLEELLDYRTGAGSYKTQKPSVLANFQQPQIVPQDPNFRLF